LTVSEHIDQMQFQIPETENKPRNKLLTLKGEFERPSWESFCTFSTAVGSLLSVLFSTVIVAVFLQSNGCGLF
jgi:hypothetical protein